MSVNIPNIFVSNFFTCGLLAFNCYRYLAVVTALTTEADFVFCPELPPPEDWQTRLCTKLEQVFQMIGLSPSSQKKKTIFLINVFILRTAILTRMLILLIYFDTFW